MGSNSSSTGGAVTAPSSQVGAPVAGAGVGDGVGGVYWVGREVVGVVAGARFGAVVGLLVVVGMVGGKGVVTGIWVLLTGSGVVGSEVVGAGVVNVVVTSLNGSSVGKKVGNSVGLGLGLLFRK